MNLPVGYKLRRLQREDYNRGFLRLQESLTRVGDISEADFNERFDLLYEKHADIFHTLVIEHEGVIVACGTVVLEFKFLFHRGIVGHIEDVAVLDVERGHNFGRSIITALDELGRSLGAYKNSLACSEANRPFYEKCKLDCIALTLGGYSGGSVEMNHYFNDDAASIHV